jgi:oxaloacetate decarboxylase gamma subunit
MSASLVSQGLELLVYGMGTVVVFLGLLVYATRLMSQVILRFFPEPVVVPRTEKAASAAQENPAVSPELLAVIAAAVHQHRLASAGRALNTDRP